MASAESFIRILNRLGYYDYQHGFILRHLRQKEGWNSHLERCRSFIMKAVEIHKPGIITVLGSGWLLELPLAEMLEKVNKVLLVDIIHPPEVVRQVSSLPGVELKRDDVSGGLIDEVWSKTSSIPFFRRLKSLDDIIVPEYEPDYDPGMVISLNIMTQLEVLPVKRLRKRTMATDEEIIRFRKLIQEKHLDFLKKHKSVLITDKAELFINKSGDVFEKQTVITDLPQGKYREEWTWDFDLQGSDYYQKRSVFNVDAIIF
jgi:hypothetical protein